ncbi:MAG: hypothetical protein V1784_05075 [bacterium]
MKRSITLAMLLAFVAVLVVACATPEQRAQKLFEQGKYEEVLAKFPNLPIAQKAKAKLAERLIEEGKYEEVLADYADTPSAYVAKEKLCEKLLAEGKFDECVQKYPGARAAKEAENKIAEKLYADKNCDLLLQKYGYTSAGMKYKNEKGTEEYNKAKKMKKADKEKALREIIQKYAGTDAAELAQESLAKMQRGDFAKNAGGSASAGGSSTKSTTSIGRGTPADDVLSIRGQCLYTEQLGSDENGLIVAWHYSDVTYIMKRWTIGGVECYRIAEIRKK